MTSSTPLDPTLALICLIVLIGAALIVINLIARRHGNHKATTHGDFGLALLFMFSFYAVMHLVARNDERVTARVTAIHTEQQAIAAGYLPQHRARLQVNLNDCPPRTDGMTDQLVMTITTQADHHPAVTGCTRIAERQYLSQGTPQ